MSRVLRFIADHYLIVPTGALVAIIGANLTPETYFRWSQALAFVVNDIGMAFVLAFIAQDVFEAMLPGGTLHPLRRAVLPVVAALTGAAGAAAAYALYILSGDAHSLLPGWRAVVAVDIGLCYGTVSSILGRRGASTFALLLAVASNAIGLLLISHPFGTAGMHPAGLLLVAAALLTAAYCRRREVRSVWPYVLVSGGLSWFGLYVAGIHPALALIPVVPFMPHSAGRRADVDHFERVFRFPVQVIGALFGLVNGGVLIRGFDDGTWAVLAAALIGRPIGILLGAAAGMGVGFHLPLGVARRDLVVIALAATPAVGFGLFFATAVFPDGPLLTQVKIGTIGSIAGVLGAAAFATRRNAGVSDVEKRIAAKPPKRAT